MVDEQVVVLNDHARVLDAQSDRIKNLTRDNAFLHEELRRREETATAHARTVAGLELKLEKQAEALQKIERALRQRGLLIPDEEFFWRSIP